MEHSGCAIPSNPEALQNFVKNFNIKNIAKSGDRVLKYLSGEEPLKLKQRTEENILSEIGEIIDKGIEFEEDTGVSVHQVPGNIDSEFNSFNSLFYDDKGNLLDDVEMLSDIEEKPYPNEHACRLNSPDKYDSFARKKCGQKHDEKCIDVIYGIKDNKSEIQALRYKKDIWTAEDAKKHCGTRGGQFEAARESSSVEEFETKDAIFRIIWRKGEVPPEDITLEDLISWLEDAEENSLQHELRTLFIELLEYRNSQEKTGAVLSAKNKNKLISAQRAIQDVLDDAGVEAEETSSVQDSEESKQEIVQDEPEKDALNVILTQTRKQIPSQISEKEVGQLIPIVRDLTRIIKASMGGS